MQPATDLWSSAHTEILTERMSIPRKLLIGTKLEDPAGNKIQIKNITIKNFDFNPKVYITYIYRTIAGKKGKDIRDLSTFQDLILGYE